MGWLIVVSVVSAWIPAKTIAEKWKRGILVPVAVIIGILCSWIATFGIAALMHYSNPEVFEASAVVKDALGFSTLSFVVAPISAIYGWRRAKNAHPYRDRV